MDKLDCFFSMFNQNEKFFDVITFASRSFYASQLPYLFVDLDKDSLSLSYIVSAFISSCSWLMLCLICNDVKAISICFLMPL